MDDGAGGTEEAEQELLAALTPVEENKATDGENPPTWIGTGFQRLLGKQKRKKKKTQWRRRGELAHGEVRPGALAFCICALCFPTAYCYRALVIYIFGVKLISLSWGLQTGPPLFR